MSAGHGGQVLLSHSTYELVRDMPPDGATFVDLGEHRLKDLADPERLHQLDLEGLPSHFPPPRSIEGRPSRLPAELTSFVGRDAEISEVERLLDEQPVNIPALAGIVTSCGSERVHTASRTSSPRLKSST